MGYLPTVLFFGVVLPLLVLVAYKVTYRAWPRVRRWFYDYWKYRRPYDVAIVAHLLVLVATTLLGKRAGRYIYTRVF